MKFVKNESESESRGTVDNGAREARRISDFLRGIILLNILLFILL